MRSFVAIVFFLLSPTKIFAQDLNLDALSAVLDAASHICGVVSQEGNQTQLEVEGEVSAALEGLISRLADAGVSGEISLSKDQYINVARDSLPVELERVRECNLAVFESLKETVIREAALTEVVRTVEEWSGWRGGGYNRQAWCNDMRTRFEQNVGTSVEWTVLHTDEQSKSDVFRRFEYKYFCRAEARYIQQ